MVLKLKYFQLKVHHDSVCVDDDDLLGSGGRCLVSSSNENKTSNKLGLNWAKLRSNLDSPSFQLRSGGVCLTVMIG